MKETEAEINADNCQTTAEQRALSQEWCSHFCLEICMLLPLLVPVPAGTTADKTAKCNWKIITTSGYAFSLSMMFEGSEAS